MAVTVPLCAAQAASVQSARVWAGPQYTRVVFDLSGPMRYRLSRDDGQITLDLGNNALANDFAAPTAHGLFKGLTSRHQGSGLQLQASVDAQSTPKTFMLKPGGGYGYRLVLDLYPDTGKSAAAPDSRATATRTAGTVVPATPDSSAGLPVTIVGSRRPTHSDVLTLRQVAAQMNGQRKVVIAIDPGHGGEDPGAHGPGGTLEKNVTLAVARQLAAIINRQPGMQAVLTRNGDYFIPLARRYQIAREKSADMFVSIHADAFKNGDAKGSSVWVLSPRGKTSMAARWLADGENRADLIGGVKLDNMNDSLAAVLVDMQQGYAMQASESIAGNVLTALGSLGPTHRGYVERANFVVLRSPDVPSILVETAFISNPLEERRLREPRHQEELAEAVMGGVRNYFESTPPPGTWFAAQAARRAGGMLADTEASAVSTSSSERSVVARKPAAPRLAAAPSEDNGNGDVHRVSRGESLRSIARQYGVSVGALRSANGIDGNTLRAGSVLTIPTG
jgi:N-acetylmuramoyl-L-alanine amidase